MSHNQFGVGTIPPPPPPAIPGYSQLPPGPPAGDHGWRWPGLIAAGLVGAAVAAVAAAAITIQARDTTTATAPTAPTPVTVTASAPAPPSPAPLPTAQADRQTCQGREEASRLISEASVAQSVIPQGMTILDPAVRSNPDWTAVFRKRGASTPRPGTR